LTKDCFKNYSASFSGTHPRTQTECFEDGERFAGTHPRDTSHSRSTRAIDYLTQLRICSAICARVNYACCDDRATRACLRHTNTRGYGTSYARRCMLIHITARARRGARSEEKEKDTYFDSAPITFVIRRRFLLFGPRARPRLIEQRISPFALSTALVPPPKFTVANDTGENGASSPMHRRVREFKSEDYSNSTELSTIFHEIMDCYTTYKYDQYEIFMRSFYFTSVNIKINRNSECSLHFYINCFPCLHASSPIFIWIT